MVANMLIAECEAAERLNGDKAPANVQPQPSGPWHHDLGHIHPMKSMETAAAGVEAGEVMREDVADALGLDIAESMPKMLVIESGIRSHQVRGRLSERWVLVSGRTG